MIRHGKLTLFFVSLLLLFGLSLSPAQTQVVEAQPQPPVYNLYATDAFVTMADGTKVYIYGFVGGRQGVDLTYQVSAKAKAGPGGILTLTGGAPAPTGGLMTVDEAPLFGNAQFPAPVIYASVGDVVEIRLKNLGVSNRPSPNDPHSIHLHGLDVNAANDGVPETSLGAIPANAGIPGAGNIVVYMFTADKPGSYMYHCHQEANIHVQMGMYGALVVYNPTDGAAAGGPGTGWGELWGWKYDRDYILLLSEFDLLQHQAEQFAGAARGYNPVNYKPQYWFINGLGFPNTIHAGVGFNWTDWIAAHPGYDPFIVGQTDVTSVAGTPGEKILLRVINMGFQTQPMHMHGFHGKIIGSDQRAWPWVQPGQPDLGGAGTPGTGMEKNTLTVGSGETYEWLLDFGVWTGHAAGTYPAGTQSRYDPATNLPQSNTDPTFPAIPDPFVLGKAYVGGPVVGPDAQASQGPGGLPAELPYTQGQYFPFHNHDDYKATNNGVYPGGMFTMIMPVP